jgi:hypothetical protein
VKTDRWLTRAAAAVLAGFLVLAAGPAGGQISINLDFGKLFARKNPSKQLAAQLQEVQQAFTANRKALPTVTAHGKPAYPRQEVVSLIARTEADLSTAIDQAQPGKMGPLNDWASDAIENIQRQVAPPPGQRAASFHDASTPRAVAVVASLGGISLPWLASVTAGPQQDTVPADTANRLLDQVGNVISRIFFLASNDDLEVKLWVGSTVPHATFSFGSQGRIKGTAQTATTIRTDGTKDHILRGLYNYKAIYSEGAVAELVQYPDPAGASAAQTQGERLDLVNGSSFFCCRFKESYCHHVDSDKECRP